MIITRVSFLFILVVVCPSTRMFSSRVIFLSSAKTANQNSDHFGVPVALLDPPKNVSSPKCQAQTRLAVWPQYTFFTALFYAVSLAVKTAPGTYVALSKYHKRGCLSVILSLEQTCANLVHYFSACPRLGGDPPVTSTRLRSASPQTPKPYVSLTLDLQRATAQKAARSLGAQVSPSPKAVPLLALLRTCLQAQPYAFHRAHVTWTSG
uniref:Secreted protein n=1 Tax=Pipistrellus kuhlii TaxID=59472 RepID=A0A7J7VV21_PIPKU|nr:hypothetical protein mPipKuh1_008320 [Pipistrellus kuhlii]